MVCFFGGLWHFCSTQLSSTLWPIGWDSWGTRRYILLIVLIHMYHVTTIWKLPKRQDPCLLLSLHGGAAQQWNETSPEQRLKASYIKRYPSKTSTLLRCASILAPMLNLNQEKACQFCISLFPWNIARLFCPLYLGIFGRRIPTRLLRSAGRRPHRCSQRHQRCFTSDFRCHQGHPGGGNGNWSVAMWGHGSPSNLGWNFFGLTNLWTWWRNSECMFPAEMKDWGWCELITIYLLYRTYSDDTSATQKAYVFAAWIFCHVAMGSLSFHLFLESKFRLCSQLM